MSKFLITKVDSGYDYNDVSSEEIEIDDSKMEEYVETEFRSILQGICEEESDEEFATIIEDKEPGKYSLKAHIDFEMGHEYIYDICVMAVKCK